MAKKASTKHQKNIAKAKELRQKRNTLLYRCLVIMAIGLVICFLPSILLSQGIVIGSEHVMLTAPSILMMVIALLVGWQAYNLMLANNALKDFCEQKQIDKAKLR